VNLLYAYLGAILAVLAILDPNVIIFLGLQCRLLLLELQKIPLRIRLEIDLFRIKHDRKRYLKMAEELRKEMGIDDEV
jgi:hypothetical protein